MKWPSQLVFKFLSEGKDNVLENLIVHFMILAQRKNNYSFAPMLSNSVGEVIITKQQLLETIQFAQRDSPMDYADGLERCKGLLVIIENEAELKERANRLSQFYPESAERLRQLMRISSNSHVKSLKRRIKSSRSPVTIYVETIPRTLKRL